MPLWAAQPVLLELDGDRAVRAQGVWATTWPVILEPSVPLAMKWVVNVAVKLFWLLRFAPPQDVALAV
jgi:hypothetical protein